MRCTPLTDPDEVVVATNSSRVRHGVIECPCSKTSFGVTRIALRHIDNALRTSNDELDHLDGMDKKARNETLSYVTGLALTSLGYCASREGYEACINAAYELRDSFARPLCTFDNSTGRNMRMNRDDGTFVSVSKCFGGFKSKQLKPPLRDAVIKPVSELHESPEPSAMPAELPAVTVGFTEGCVAVEHLTGFVLQHKKHLLRPVLCARGFCATPNHAIVFRGALTSMKRLCDAAVFDCTNDVKFVNNLKVAVNRRVEISDEIVVTPYDIRFPKALIWAVQMMEDVFNLVTAGAFLLVPLVIYGCIDKSIWKVACTGQDDNMCNECKK